MQSENALRMRFDSVLAENTRTSSVEPVNPANLHQPENHTYMVPRYYMEPEYVYEDVVIDVPQQIYQRLEKDSSRKLEELMEARMKSLKLEMAKYKTSVKASLAQEMKQTVRDLENQNQNLLKSLENMEEKLELAVAAQ